MEPIEGSVTKCLNALRNGSDDAVELIWSRYNHSLIAIVNRWLKKSRDIVNDGEDITIEAFDSFLRRHRKGDFPALSGREDMWRMLLVIAYRKAVNSIRNSNRQCRRSGSAQHVSSNDFDVPDRGPPPDIEFELADSIRHLLGLLSDDLREIAASKMTGYSNAEIATKLGKSLATIERRLRLIRMKWEFEVSR